MVTCEAIDAWSDRVQMKEGRGMEKSAWIGAIVFSSDGALHRSSCPLQ